MPRCRFVPALGGFVPVQSGFVPARAGFVTFWVLFVDGSSDSITMRMDANSPESRRCMRRSRRATAPPIRGAPPWFTPRPRGSPPRAGPSKSDQEYLCAQPPPAIPVMLAWCASLSAWASRPRYAVLRCLARGRGSPVAPIPAVVNTRCSSFGQHGKCFIFDLCGFFS